MEKKKKKVKTETWIRTSIYVDNVVSKRGVIMFSKYKKSNVIRKSIFP